MKNINSILLDKRRTSIFIAHRCVRLGLNIILRYTDICSIKISLRTVVEADIIFVFNHGEVVEQGTHQELLEKNGLYHSMWIEQAYKSPEEYASEEADEQNTEQPETSQEKR